MLSEHGIYIRHCQESSSQPVPSQAGADTTRPRWRQLQLHFSPVVPPERNPWKHLQNKSNRSTVFNNKPKTVENKVCCRVSSATDCYRSSTELEATFQRASGTVSTAGCRLSRRSEMHQHTETIEKHHPGNGSSSNPQSTSIHTPYHFVLIITVYPKFSSPLTIIARQIQFLNNS